MIHTAIISDWLLAHARRNKRWLWVLPVVPPIDDYYKRDFNYVYFDNGMQLKSFPRRTCQYQPGDTIEFCNPAPDPASQRITGEWLEPVLRAVVLSETAKRLDELTADDASRCGWIRAVARDDYPSLERLWNASHPEAPWHEDLFVWCCEMETRE